MYKIDDNKIENSIQTPIFQWAIESALGDCKSETTELIRSCSLLLRLLKQLYKPIIDEISNFDEPLNRLNNLKTWMKITKSFIEEDLKMAMVCSIPDFNKIAFYLDSEEGILNYEACIMIMLACFIAQSPSKTQLPILTYPFRQDNTDNQQPICLHTRFDLSSILVSADNNQISASLKLINDERFRIQFELFDVKNVFTGCFNNRYCNGNLVNNGDISLMSDDLYSDKSFDSSMALINEYSTIRLNKPNSSYRISSSTLSEMIEELETELDNRNTEIQQLKALVLQKSEELDKLRNKAQNFQDELAFKITYADQIDNLLEEASKVQHLEQQLKNAEKKIMESNVLQKSIKNLKEENERLRKEFDDLKFRELINHKNEQTKLQTEIKILTEKAAHFEETNIEKTKRLVELETELALFQNLTNTGSIKDVHSCKEMYTSEESMYVLHNDLPNDSIALSKESFACDNYICNGSGIKKWPIACKHFTNSTIDKQCQVDMCNKKSPEIGYNHQLISKHECYIQTEEYGTRNASIQTDGKLVKEMRRSINIENMPSVKVRDIQFHPTFSVVIQRAACSQHCSSSVNNRQHRRDRNSCGNKTASARFSASQVKRCSTKKSDKCNAHKRQVESNKIKDKLNSSYYKQSKELNDISDILNEKNNPLKEVDFNLMDHYGLHQSFSSNEKSTAEFTRLQSHGYNPYCFELNKTLDIKKSTLNNELNAYHHLIDNDQRCFEFKNDRKKFASVNTILKCSPNFVTFINNPRSLQSAFMYEEWAQFGCV